MDSIRSQFKDTETESAIILWPMPIPSIVIQIRIMGDKLQDKIQRAKRDIEGVILVKEVVREWYKSNVRNGDVRNLGSGYDNARSEVDSELEPPSEIH